MSWLRAEHFAEDRQQFDFDHPELTRRDLALAMRHWMPEAVNELQNAVKLLLILCDRWRTFCKVSHSMRVLLMKASLMVRYSRV